MYKRQIYKGGEISARDVWQKLPDQPTYSTVRTLLGVLEEKGYLTRRLEGKAFLYQAKHAREKVAESALRRLLSTFFGGSVEQAVTGLLQLEDSNLTSDELRRIERMISQARKRTTFACPAQRSTRKRTRRDNRPTESPSS